MAEQLQRTPLYDTHRVSGGRMVPFSGWEMPVQYSGILDEARAVRARSGVFDVSHMGRVQIEGPGASTLLSRVFSAAVDKVRIGRARYGVICDESGGIIDDCIVYRRGEERFLLVPNAGNTPDVLDWLERWAPADTQARIEDVTARLAMIAHQGPQAVGALQPLAQADLVSLRPFAAVETAVDGVETLLARTGYTGEDGFELMVPREDAEKVWSLLLELGATPCGLGARDVLRLEAGLLLHGNDMDRSVNPYEAGLGRFVEVERDGYVAGPALRRIRTHGVTRVLVGFAMVGRGVARHGHPIVDSSRQIGHVSSGSYSPTLDSNIGLGYVPTGFSAPGTRFEVDIRGRLVEAEVTALPFYSRKRSA